MGWSENEKSRIEVECARAAEPNTPRSNVLHYSAVRQILWGTVGGRRFGPVSAPSGAGQDGVTARAVRYQNWSPRLKAGAGDADARGGAIVPGWWIVLPERLGKGDRTSHLPWGGAPTSNSLRVVPYRLDASYEDGVRNSFYIHGTGGKGSDGCILIEPSHRQVLVDRVSKGGGAWLHVYVSGIELNDALERSARGASPA